MNLIPLALALLLAACQPEVAKGPDPTPDYRTPGLALNLNDEFNLLLRAQLESCEQRLNRLAMACETPSSE